MYTLYGIPNCDSVKKAKKHLEASSIDFDFVDFKKTPPTVKDLKRWQSYLEELPVNKRGTTFRKFKDDYEAANDKEKMRLLIENSSAIKRPVLEKKEKVVAIGWQEVSQL
jgi:arsenate reductase